MEKWREKLQPASFRGVPFKTAEHTSGGGRDLVPHEMPDQDLPYHEDMRASTRPFSFRAYVLGDDYFKNRNDLITALNKKGPGILIHPSLGTLNVVALPYTMSENFQAEGGMARFDLRFEETGDPAVPEPAPDYDALAVNAADDLDDAAGDEFISKYDVTGPSFLKDGMVGDALAYAEQAGNLIATIPEMVEESAVGQIISDLQDIDWQISSVVYQASEMVNYFQGKLEGISNLEQYVGSFAAFNVLMDLLKFGDDDNPSAFHNALDSIPLTTTARIQQNQNRNAFKSLMVRGALSQAVKLAIKTDYTSREQADSFRKILGEAIEGEIIIAGDNYDDAGYESLKTLKVMISRSLTQKAGQLPRILQYKVPPAVTPALVLAYRLYQDVDRESEIIERNPIVVHPGFLPSGEYLEVLNE